MTDFCEHSEGHSDTFHFFNCETFGQNSDLVMERTVTSYTENITCDIPLRGWIDTSSGHFMACVMAQGIVWEERLHLFVHLSL